MSMLLRYNTPLSFDHGRLVQLMRILAVARLCFLCMKYITYQMYYSSRMEQVLYIPSLFILYIHMINWACLPQSPGMRIICPEPGHRLHLFTVVILAHPHDYDSIRVLHPDFERQTYF